MICLNVTSVGLQGVFSCATEIEFEHCADAAKLIKGMFI